jgi:SNF2 family DNA or RNA helicase
VVAWFVFATSRSTSVIIDQTKFKTKSFQHQLEGVEFLADRQYGGLLDDMGMGKSKVLVDLGCVLWEAREVTDIVVACPAGVKTVWSNLRIGEIAKHCWVDSVINEWASSSTFVVRKEAKLTWTIVSYECLRKPSNVGRLISALKNRKVMLICDESIRLKGHKSQQTVGTLRLRRVACQRAYIANGTPIGNSPLDLYCQMEILSPNILRCDSFYQFRNRHAVMISAVTKQGKKYGTIAGYQRLDVLKQQIKPHVIRRLKKDCLDLPPKIYCQREVAFTEASWKRYCEMRDQSIILLQDKDAVAARQAIVKLIRLRQLTCGFVSGTDSGETVETSAEKMQAVLEWVEEVVEQEPTGAIIIWSFFRFEQQRYFDELKSRGYSVVRVHGGQNKTEREDAVEAFNIDTKHLDPDKPIILLGNQQAGGLGLNLTRSHNVAYSSNDYNLVNRQQSEDRVDRYGQTTSPNITDFLVTGPKGQRTIDHIVFAALKKKEDLANYTTSDWVQKLKDDEPFDWDDIAF